MICERQEGWAELPVEEQAQLFGRQGVHYVVAEAVRVVDDQGCGGRRPSVRAPIS